MTDFSQNICGHKSETMRCMWLKVGMGDEHHRYYKHTKFRQSPRGDPKFLADLTRNDPYLTSYLWLKAFSHYVAALTSCESPAQATGLVAHVHLILQLSQELGPQWLKYDTEFWQWAAARSICQWGDLNTGTACKLKIGYLLFLPRRLFLQWTKEAWKPGGLLQVEFQGEVWLHQLPILTLVPVVWQPSSSHILFVSCKAEQVELHMMLKL